MEREEKYLLLLVNNKRKNLYPVCIGSRAAIIDYLAEYTIEIMTRYRGHGKSSVSGMFPYEEIWKHYDDNFYPGGTTPNGHPCYKGNTYKSEEFGYLLFPMDSISLL